MPTLCRAYTHLPPHAPAPSIAVAHPRTRSHHLDGCLVITRSSPSAHRPWQTAHFLHQLSRLAVTWPLSSSRRRSLAAPKTRMSELVREAASGEFDKFQCTEWPRQRCVEIRDFNAPPNFNAPGPAPSARRRPAQAPQTAPPGRGGLWGNAPGVGSTPTGAPALRPIFRLFRGYRTLTEIRHLAVQRKKKKT